MPRLSPCKTRAKVLPPSWHASCNADPLYLKRSVSQGIHPYPASPGTCPIGGDHYAIILVDWPPWPIDRDSGKKDRLICGGPPDRRFRLFVSPGHRPTRSFRPEYGTEQGRPKARVPNGPRSGGWQRPHGPPHIGGAALPDTGAAAHSLRDHDASSEVGTQHPTGRKDRPLDTPRGTC